MKTYDLCLQWRKEGQSVISGFHSPMEKECLRILLKGTQPIIVCPARGMWKRIPPELREPLNSGRLLITTKFPKYIHRVTSHTAFERNRFVAELAYEILISYARPSGRVEALAKEMILRGKRVLTFASDYNENLISIGATQIDS